MKYKLFVLGIGLILSTVALTYASDYFISLGVHQGKNMCTDILNNCSSYCEEAVRRGYYK